MNKSEAVSGSGAGLDLGSKAWDRIEPILESFERALSRGERPILDDFVPVLEPAERRALLGEMAHAELEFRLKAGEPARVEDYLTRYPELRSNTVILLGLIRTECQVRRQRESAINRAEYQARFPEHAATLARLLAETPHSGKSPGHGRPVSPSAGLEESEAGAGPLPELVRLGDFRILREIGRGGMGVVYEAEQVSLGRHVAVKVLPQKLLVDTHTKQRFEREAKSAAKLHHTNIVPVFSVGEHDGMPYYAMQFICGHGLDEVLEELQHLVPGAKATGFAAPLSGSKRRGMRKDVSAADVARSLLRGQFAPDTAENAAAAHAELATTIPAGGTVSAPLSLAVPPVPATETAPKSGLKLTYWQSTARIGLQVADALEYAHKQGVQHRDIKPSNLLLDTAGTVWVTDFGLAKADDQQNLTQTGDILGTLRYMPPEAFEGQADVRGDIYSLGLTLYELLALRPAFDERDRNRLIKQVTTAEPRRLDRLNPAVPRDLVTIIHKAIDREPAHRYPTAAALGADLQRFLSDESIHARRQTQLERCVRWARHHPGIAVLGGVLTAVLVLATTASLLAARYFNLSAQSERDARHEADRRGDAERWARYRSTIAAASAALQLQNSGAARSALEDAPTEHRNWEWQYFYSQLHDASLVLPVPGGSVSSLVLSPSGRQIAVRCLDHNDVYLCDVATGRIDYVLRGHSAPPTAVAYRPDGKQVATASDDQTVRLWDPATGVQTECLKADLAPHNLGKNSVVAYSPDGSRIASYALTGFIALPGLGASRLWDTGTGQEIAVLSEWQELGPPVAFSPDGKRVAAASREHVRLCDTVTGSQVAVLGHAEMVQVLAYSSDGKRIASATAGGNAIHLWDAESGEEVAVLCAHTESVIALLFSPDGSRLVSGSNYPDTTAWLWDATTGRLICALAGHKNSIRSVAFSPDGRRVVTASSDQTARLWDGRTGEFLAGLNGHTHEVRQVVFSPNGVYVVTASRDATLMLWDAETGELISVLRGHNDGPNLFCPPAFTPDGSRLVSGSDDGTVRIWDMTLAERNGILRGHKSYVYDVAFSPDGVQVASGGWDGTVRIWDATTGRETSPPLSDEAKVITSVAYSLDGQRLATMQLHEGFTLWDLASRTATRNWRITPSRYDPRASLNPAGTLLAAGSPEGPVRLWDVNTGQEVARLEGHDGDSIDVAFHPNESLLATTGRDRTVRLWDGDTRAPVAILLGHTSEVFRVAFSSDGKLLASGSEDKTIRLWDTQTHEQLAQIPAGSIVYGVAFKPDGTRLAAGCRDKTIRLIDVARRQQVAELRGHTDYVHAVAWSPDGTRLVSGSGDFTVRVWDSLSAQERAMREMNTP